MCRGNCPHFAQIQTKHTSKSAHQQYDDVINNKTSADSVMSSLAMTYTMLQNF